MVHYVSEFSFPKSPARPTVVAGSRPTIAGYAKGGHVKASTPQPFSRGGSTTPFRYKDGGATKGVDGKQPAYAKLNDKADPKGTQKEKSSGVQKPAFAEGGKVATGKIPSTKGTFNENDAVSPGSFKRTPPKQSKTNKEAANDKFDAEGRNTEPATKQEGTVQRMSGFSDFKNGGRIKNLGHYAHGGKVKASGEKSSGTAGSSKVKAPVAKVSTPKKAEPTKAPAGSRVEMKSGTAKASMGGLSRGNSKAKNAAIHAKSSKPKAGALAAIAGALSQAPHQPAGPGIGAPPPGMAPGMGSPPGGAMAPRSAPPMAGGPMQAGMSTGGAVRHVVIHHVKHGAK